MTPFYYFIIFIFYIILPESLQGKIHSTVLFLLGFNKLLTPFWNLNYMPCDAYDHFLITHSTIYYICNTIRISTIEYSPKMNIFLFHHFFSILGLLTFNLLKCDQFCILFLIWASLGGFFYHLSLLFNK